MQRLAKAGNCDIYAKGEEIELGSCYYILAGINFPQHNAVIPPHH